MKKKIIFMGTPEFAVPILQMLIDNYDVVAVVSQPDKVSGRHHELKCSAIKSLALKHHILVLQPVKIRQDYADILKITCDMIVTCAYGQIIPEVILNYPPDGCINVHASLLPKLRGGAPIQHAILDGYEKTGITIMYMAPGMDDGDIIKQEEYVIKDNDTLGSLNAILSMMGAKLLEDTLPSIFEHQNNRVKQNAEEVTFAYTVKREEEHINFNSSVLQVARLIRALNPEPYAYTIINDMEYKIISGHYIKTNSEPNKINIIDKKTLGIGCLDGIYFIDEIKPAGKKQLLIKDFLNGIAINTFKDYQIK